MAKEKRSYHDRREYLIVAAVAKRRKAVRLMALSLKGKRCARCGYDRCLEALEFHHLDGRPKDFGISDGGHTRSWEKVQKELESCILLCANCHREIHAGMQLSREIEIEKPGEFREACPSETENGNPERSLEQSSRGTCRD